jgi:hypothetical protein
MKKNKFAAFCSALVILFAQPQVAMSAPQGAVVKNLTMFESKASSVADLYADSLGNRITNLNFFGQVTFEGKTYSSYDTPSGGSSQSLIFKSDSTGKLLWLREVPGPASMAVAPNGDIAVTTLTMGLTNQGAPSLTGCTNPCGHLEVWSGDGETKWAKKFPGPNYVSNPKFDEEGNLYISVSVSGSRILSVAQTMFAPYVLEATATRFAWVLAKYGQGGVVSWAKQVPAGSDFKDYAVSQKGEVYVSGTFIEEINIPKWGAVSPAGKFENGYLLVLGQNGDTALAETFSHVSGPIQSASLQAFPDSTFGLVTNAAEFRVPSGAKSIPSSCISNANTLWKISPKTGDIQWCSADVSGPFTSTASGSIFATLANDPNTTVVAFTLSGVKKWNLTIATEAIGLGSMVVSQSGELLLTGSLSSGGPNGPKMRGLPLDLGSGMILKSSSSSESVSGGGQDGLILGIQLPVGDYLKTITKKSQVSLPKGIFGSSQLRQVRAIIGVYAGITSVTCEAATLTIAKASCKPFIASGSASKANFKASSLAKSKKVVLITVVGQLK